MSAMKPRASPSNVGQLPAITSERGLLRHLATLRESAQYGSALLASEVGYSNRIAKAKEIIDNALSGFDDGGPFPVTYAAPEPLADAIAPIIRAMRALVLIESGDTTPPIMTKADAMRFLESFGWMCPFDDQPTTQESTP